MNSPTFSCTRKIHFCAGHRVFQHESKCGNVHGHEYMIEISARPKSDLDSLGRVIDFSEIKAKVETWIDENWDHGMLLNSQDPIRSLWFKGILKDHKFYVLPYNPTAENIAHYLLTEICPVLFADTNVEVFQITCHETPKCRATVTL